MNEADVRALIRAATDSGVKLWAEDGRLHFKTQKGKIPDALRAALQSRKNDLIGELSQPVFRKRENTPAVVQYPPYWKDFWEETQANPSLSHGPHFAIRLTGEIGPARIESALNRLTSRHDLLRSSVRLENGIPCLVLERDGALPVELIDVSGGAVEDRPARVKAAVEWAIHAPFEKGQVYRAQIIRISGKEYVVAAVIHHFVADAVSRALLVRELISSLHNEHFPESPADDRPLQYTDYLLGFNEWLRGEGLRYRLEYWRKHMRSAPAVHFPLTDDARSAEAEKLELVKIRVDEALRAKFALNTRAAGIPFGTAVLVANFAALASVLKCSDLVTIIIHSGRTDPALLQMVGFTVNCFPIRVAVVPGMSFAELLTRVDDAYALARDYHVPWGLLMRELREIDVSCIAPIFNYLPATQAGAGDSGSASKASRIGIEFLAVEGPEQTNSVDWKSHELFVADAGVNAVVTLKYMPSRYQAAAVHEFADAFLRCLQMMAEDPTQPVDGLKPREH